MALLRTPHFVDYILFLPCAFGLRKATERKVVQLALSTLTHVALESPETDRLLVAHDACLRAIFAVLDSADAAGEPLFFAARALDFLTVEPANRAHATFFPGLLAALARRFLTLQRGGNDVWGTARHALTAAANLCASEALLFPVARAEGMVDGLCTAALLPVANPNLAAGSSRRSVASSSRVLTQQSHAAFVGALKTPSRLAVEVLLQLARLPANHGLLRAHRTLAAALAEKEDAADRKVAAMARHASDLLSVN
eukprot:gnl/Chilomastix_cuspidata/1166.p6 GENE.gnl/Chilomastix_cuspidata/1166~~gnl/Chilomastix_cuspidata/1166.p6  ORF type:complete len:255 (+),score=137.71 gnl/Chilomastix_cuspidata/1166:4863-5627(+)